MRPSIITTARYEFRYSSLLSSAKLASHQCTRFRVFTCSSSSHAPCSPDCLISRRQQIFFTFDFEGLGTFHVLNLMPNTCWESAHRRMVISLQDSFPIEDHRLRQMIEYALGKARIAYDDGIPPENSVVHIKGNVIRIPWPDWMGADWMETGGRFASPADDRAIESLTTNALSSSMEYLGTCTICIEDFIDGEETLCMPCSHGFHGHCIREWLKNSHYCPICRFPLPTTTDSIHNNKLFCGLLYILGCCSFKTLKEWLAI